MAEIFGNTTTTPIDPTIFGGGIREEDANKTFANALIDTANGTNIVSVTDISPLEHPLRVNLSSDDTINFEGVAVTRYGTNLLNGKILNSATNTKHGVTITYDENSGIYTFNTKDGEASTSSGKQYLCKHSFPAIKGEKHVCSVTKIGGTISGSESTPYVWIGQGDTANDTNNYLNVNLKGGKKTDVLKSEYITSMWFILPKDMKFDNYQVKIQLEKGDISTEHQLYVEPITEKADTNGKVTGLTSVYPTTVLTTNTGGVTINCEYNKDLNKAFEQLKLAMVSGGNV